MKHKVNMIELSTLYAKGMITKENIEKLVGKEIANEMEFLKNQSFETAKRAKDFSKKIIPEPNTQNPKPDFYLITGNKNKIEIAKSILGDNLQYINLDLDEIQSQDSDKVAEHKVKQAYRQIQKPLFVLDQSLYLDCLNQFPGPLIKDFWQTVSLKKICEIANNFNNHKVTAKTTLTFFDGKELKHFYGIFKGQIPKEPKGDKGFGWDPIFIPEGHTQTFAEIGPGQKGYAADMYKIALEKFEKFIQSRQS